MNIFRNTCSKSKNYKPSIQYFENAEFLQNTLLPYFYDGKILISINKLFSKLDYEKYNTHIQPHGIIESYNPKTKLIIEQNTYKNGSRSGLYKYWHSNGKLWIKCMYKNDKLNGLRTTWYNNGQLFEKLIYIEGKVSAIYERCRRDGELDIITIDEFMIRTCDYNDNCCVIN